jgi:hypothetical protein
MPNAAIIVLNDGTTDKSFVPQAIRSDKAIFIERSLGQGNLQSVLSLSTRRNANGTQKGVMDLSTIKPVTDSTTGVVSPDGKSLATITTSIPSNLTDAERASFMALVAAAVKHAMVSLVLRDGESIY